MPLSSAGTAPRADAVADRPGAASRVRLLDRLVPLSGLLFALLIVVGGPVLEGNTPDSSATGGQVISFYAAHQVQERAAAVVLALGFAVLVVFAASLRRSFAEPGGPEGIATLALVGAAVLAAGQTITAGAGYALAGQPHALAPAAAQVLNVIANEVVLTSTIGALLFGVPAGLVVLRGGGRLPTWLGWPAIVGALLVLVPGIDLLGILVLLAWCATIGVLLFRAGGRATRAPSQAIPPA